MALAIAKAQDPSFVTQLLDLQGRSGESFNAELASMVLKELFEVKRAALSRALSPVLSAYRKELAPQYEQRMPEAIRSLYSKAGEPDYA